MFEPGQKYSRWQTVIKRHQKQIRVDVNWMQYYKKC